MPGCNIADHFRCELPFAFSMAISLSSIETVIVVPFLVLNFTESTSGDCRYAVGMIATLCWALAERQRLSIEHRSPVTIPNQTIFATPMVILYRLSKVMEIEGRLRGLHKKIKFIGLPNILADRPIMPELLQDAATPEALAAAALRLLNDITARSTARQELEAVRAMLGGPGASERTRAQAAASSGVICG